MGGDDAHIVSRPFKRTFADAVSQRLPFKVHSWQRALSQRSADLCLEGNAAASQTAAECLLANQIRLLVHAACAARLGAAHMTLSDWRDVEQEVKQKLENEKQKTNRQSKAVSRL